MEFDQFFKIGFKCFELCGFNLMERYSCNLKSALRFTFCVSLWISLQICGEFTAIFILEKFDHFDASPFAVVNCVILHQTNLKFLAVWYNRSAIIDIINSLRENFPSSDDQRFKVRIEKAYTALDRFQKAYFCNIMVYGVVASLSGLAKTSLKNFENDTLAHSMWLPFTIDGPGKYFAVFFLVGWLSIQCIFFTLGNELTMLGLIQVLSIEFEVLSLDMAQIDAKTDYKIVVELIKRHDQLLKISESIESIFSSSIFLTLTGSAIILCFPLIQVITAKQTMDVLKSVCCIQTYIIQIFLLCFYGEKLKSSSYGVTESALLWNWYECDDKRLVHAMKLVFFRAQRHSQLTALKFVNISIETFGDVRENFIFSLYIYLIFTFRFSRQLIRISLS